MTKKVAIFISGGGSNMRALVASMTGDHPARPVLVLSNNETSGTDWARGQGIATEIVDHRPHKGNRESFEADINRVLARYAPDIICLAGFMRVLTAGFVTPWAGKMLNTHPSLLPKYKGLNTHARALEAGDAYHGCTVHEVTPLLDDGPILGQARVAVEPGDTPEALAARVLVREHILYPAVLKNFASGDRKPIMLD